MDPVPLVEAKAKATVKLDTKDSDGTQVTKKRRTSASGAAITTATTETMREEEQGPHSTGRIRGNNGKPVRKTNTPFQRVKPEAVADLIVQNNHYEAKVRTRFYPYLLPHIGHLLTMWK